MTTRTPVLSGLGDENDGEQIRYVLITTCTVLVRVSASSRGLDVDAAAPAFLRDNLRARTQPKPLSRDQRRAYRAQLAKYEARGSSFGQSVVWTMYLLAEALGRTDVDAVW